MSETERLFAALMTHDSIVVTENDDGWAVELIELSGHVGAGDTLEEAVAMALDAAAAWAVAAKRGG
jgi:predicted RNase H-like HicB family nuclease